MDYLYDLDFNEKVQLAEKAYIEESKINFDKIYYHTHKLTPLVSALNLAKENYQTSEKYIQLLTSVFRLVIEKIKVDEYYKEESDATTEFKNLLAAFILKNPVSTINSELVDLFKENNKDSNDFLESLFLFIFAILSDNFDSKNKYAFWKFLANIKESTDKQGISIPNKLIPILLFNAEKFIGQEKGKKLLENQEYFIKELISSFSATAIGFKSSLKLLTGLGSGFLPFGFVWIISGFNKVQNKSSFWDKVTISYGEKLVSLMFSSFALEIKKNKQLKEQFISFLNELINQKSAIAFQILENIISLNPNND